MLETSPLSPGRVRFVEWLQADLTLTPIELRIVQVFGRHFGEWVPSADIVAQIYGSTPDTEILDYARAAFRTHLWRTRRKLEHTSWRIENRYKHGVYRLVEALAEPHDSVLTA